MNLLDETITIFQTIRSGVVLAMQKLYQVKEEGAWEGKYSSFGEFVEEGLGISQGFASKLLTVNKHYLLEGAVSPEQITGIDYEKLYMASKLGGRVEEQLAKAKTLSRSELKLEKGDEDQHAHEPITICRHCSVRL